MRSFRLEETEEYLEETEEEPTVYTESGREELLDADAAQPWETAFMRGWDEG